MVKIISALPVILVLHFWGIKILSPLRAINLSLTYSTIIPPSKIKSDTQLISLSIILHFSENPSNIISRFTIQIVKLLDLQRIFHRMRFQQGLYPLT